MPARTRLVIGRRFGGTGPVGTWARDSGTFLFVDGLTRALAIGLTFLLARGLTPAQWGGFSATLSIALTIALLAESGITNYLLREVAQAYAGDHDDPATARARADGLTRAAFLLCIRIGIPVVALASMVRVIIPFTPTSAVATFGLFGYSVVTIANGTMDSYLRGRRLIRPLVLFSLAEKAMLIGLVGACFMAEASVAVYSLAYCAAVSLRLVLSLKRLPKPDSSHRPTVWSILRPSLPFAVTRGALNALPRLDVALVAVAGPLATAYFALGDKMVAPAMLVAIAMSTALMPHSAEPLTGNALTRTALWIAIALGTVISAAGIVLTPMAVAILVGQRYAPAIPVVRLMLTVIPFVYAANVLLTGLYARGMERSVATVAVVVTVIGPVSVLGAATKWGAVGGASAYVLRQVLLVAGLGIVASRGARGRGSRAGPKDPIPTPVQVSEF